jgi:hypothetical protein
MSKRFAIAVAAAGLMSASIPSLAQAADYCVDDAACSAQIGAIDKTTLPEAITAADMDTAPDTIHLGAGTYAAPTTTGFAPAHAVAIVGAGADATHLTGPKNTDTVLTLSDGTSSVSNLEIAIPDSSGSITEKGLDMIGGSASDIAITAPNGLANVAGAWLQGTALRDARIPLTLDPASIGVFADTDTSLNNVQISAGTAVAAMGYDIRIDRADLTADYVGVWSGHLNTTITNSLVHAVSPGIGLMGGTGHLQADVSMNIRNVTVVGDGGSSVGIDVNSFALGKTATVTVDSSIIRGVQHALTREASGGTALLAMQYSSYDPFSVVDGGQGGLSAGTGNTGADPLFAGPDNFRLAAGSPAIDTANPAASPDALDLAGNPRVVGGRRDMGAYEVQPATVDPAPPVDATPAADTTPPAPVAAKDVTAPVIAGLKIAPTRFKARRGTHLRFTLSERAGLAITIKRRAARSARPVKVATLRRTQAAGAVSVTIKKRIGRARLRPGRYTATILATDAAGNRSRAYRVKFTVMR